MRAVARLLATGQVLLASPSAPADTRVVVIAPDPTPDLAKMARELDEAAKCTGYDSTSVWPEPPVVREREPWRRGRPLR